MIRHDISLYAMQQPLDPFICRVGSLGYRLFCLLLLKQWACSAYVTTTVSEMCCKHRVVLSHGRFDLRDLAILQPAAKVLQ